MSDNAAQSEISCYQHGSLPNLDKSDWSQLQDLAATSTKARAIELEPLFIEQRNLFKSDSLKKDIELIVDCQATNVYGDYLKLKLLLFNLLNNNSKFTLQGEIHLQACDRAKTVEISVSDTGIGIEPEKQATIFDAFIQEDASIRRCYGGTGLGLTICKQLVELMGGKITLSSEGRNMGTQVTITLPK